MNRIDELELRRQELMLDMLEEYILVCRLSRQLCQWQFNRMVAQDYYQRGELLPRLYVERVDTSVD